MKELFGTDGIRGEVGVFPLTQEAVCAIGKSIGIWLKERCGQNREALKIVIAKDTRESGDELERALLEGAHEEAITGIRLGTAPTPTVSYLTRALAAQLGVAISASHNPGSDNGIKFFDAQGYKLFPQAENEIAAIFFQLPPRKPTTKQRLILEKEFDYFPRYLDFTKSILETTTLEGLTIVVDCAYGSFSQVAPRIFQELGAKVIALHNTPDGTNINVNCGTLHPQALAQEVIRNNADVGVAFDGDGDRVMLSDEKGVILDGDHILAILGSYLQEEKRLNNNLIVSTQMSNIGLELFLEQKGIRLFRASVGDKYVLEEMLKQKASLGGEQSGHIIFLEHTHTGDGLVAALELIKIMLKKKKPLSKLDQKFHQFPQLLVNIKVKEKTPFELIAGFPEAAERYRKLLGKKGRLFIRYSGTEKLARIMIEGKNLAEIEQMAQTLAKIVQDAIGVKS
ncbi:MAG: phosphoglucosamine mutase [Candidatus Omnitrophota bacterium]